MKDSCYKGKNALPVPILTCLEGFAEWLCLAKFANLVLASVPAHVGYPNSHQEATRKAERPRHTSGRPRVPSSTKLHHFASCDTALASFKSSSILHLPPSASLSANLESPVQIICFLCLSTFVRPKDLEHLANVREPERARTIQPQIGEYMSPAINSRIRIELALLTVSRSTSGMCVGNSQPRRTSSHCVCDP